jgi:hypothetical protein
MSKEKIDTNQIVKDPDDNSKDGTEGKTGPQN